MRRTTYATSLLSIAMAFCNVAGQATTLGMIPAQEAATNTKALKYGINWINSLPEAQERARRERKPIFWLHILGNIDGFA